MINSKKRKLPDSRAWSCPWNGWSWVCEGSENYRGILHGSSYRVVKRTNHLLKDLEVNCNPNIFVIVFIIISFLQNQNEIVILNFFINSDQLDFPISSKKLDRFKKHRFLLAFQNGLFFINRQVRTPVVYGFSFSLFFSHTHI